MNLNENKISTDAGINASLRVSLLALFGGAAVWLVVGLALGVIASLTFHQPDMFADCRVMTYGHAAPAANDALLYGFCIPSALGVMLWIFARLGKTPLALPMVPVVAANLWHLGVLVGLVGILAGESTGHTWLEFSRASSVLLFTAFLLIAVTAAATFGARRERELHPAHWFLIAALLWFPWIYSTANLLLTANAPVRGVVQPIIGWWFANNLVFVWLALAGVGTAFYLLPKIAARPLATTGYALFAFLTLIFFGAWCGIPTGAPVPAWLPTLSGLAGGLLLVPLLAIAIIVIKTVSGTKIKCQGGSFCFIKFGMICFILSGLMYAAGACPKYSGLLEFTWFGPAQVQLQLLGFFTMVMLGAIYELLPGVMEDKLPFPKLAKLHFWLAIAGVLLFVIPLAIAGVEQGIKLQHADVPLADANAAAMMPFRISTTGQLILLLGALLFALNLFVMTARWKIALFKKALAAIKAPLPVSEVKA
jgi:cytochrome c oxidase cbb3-type subunit 1